MSVSPEPGFSGGINRAAIPSKPVKQASRPRYRACLVCSYVQSSPDWIQMGCPNCEEIIEVQGSLERVRQCTSLQFDGVIAMIIPDKSWVAKWQRISPMKPGLYAARVIGRPPQSVIKRLKSRGIPYVPRDDPSGDTKIEDEEEGEGDEEEDEDEEDEEDLGIVDDDDEE